MTGAGDTLVLGIGNVLLADEGVGVHVATLLEGRLAGVPGLSVLDGGTLGLELLGPIEDAQQLIVVDCMRAGRAAGSVTVLRDREATEWTTGRVTAHDLGLPSVFALAQLRGWQPRRVAVVGVEPDRLEPSLSLSPPVERGALEAAEQVVDLLRQWEVLSPKPADRLRNGPAALAAPPLGDR